MIEEPVNWVWIPGLHCQLFTYVFLSLTKIFLFVALFLCHSPRLYGFALSFCVFYSAMFALGIHNNENTGHVNSHNYWEPEEWRKMRRGCTAVIPLYNNDQRASARPAEHWPRWWGRGCREYLTIVLMMLVLVPCTPSGPWVLVAWSQRWTGWRSSSGGCPCLYAAPGPSMTPCRNWLNRWLWMSRPQPGTTVRHVNKLHTSVYFKHSHLCTHLKKKENNLCVTFGCICAGCEYGVSEHNKRKQQRKL